MTHGSAPASAGVDEIRRRLAERRRTGSSEPLWPGVPYEVRRHALGRIRSVVGCQLRAGSERVPLVAADAQEARALGIAGFISGTGPLLGWWIEQGLLEASEQTREVFARHLEHGRLRIARLRGHVARIVGAMRELGVEPILLKGLHTGEEYFPHPATRPAADIDLLVRPTEVSEARKALRALGFVETKTTRFADRSEWTPAGMPGEVRSLEFDHVDNTWSVDLHRALDRWYFRGVRRDLGPEAFATTREIGIDGERVRVLGEPTLVAFLAIHACHHLGSVHLVRLLELALVARRDAEQGRLDWNALSELLERTDTARFAYPALALADEIAPGVIDRRTLERVGRRATPRLRRVLAAVRDANLGPLSEKSLDLKLSWAIGLREVLLNLTEIVVPSDDGLPVGWLRLQRQRIGVLRGGRPSRRGEAERAEGATGAP